MRGLDEWLPPASSGHRNRLIDRAGSYSIVYVRALRGASPNNQRDIVLLFSAAELLHSVDNAVQKPSGW
jgi:hypothetical protein